MDKKGLEPSGTMMIVIVFVVILAIIIILALYFSSSTQESGVFQYATDWESGFKWV